MKRRSKALTSPARCKKKGTGTKLGNEKNNLEKVKSLNIVHEKLQKSKDMFSILPVHSEEYTNTLCPAVKSSFVYSSSSQNIRINKVELVENQLLRREFLEKKKSMKEEGSSVKELHESLAYLHEFDKNKVAKICESGLYVGNSNLTSLGKPSMGVYLCQHADVLSPAPMKSKDIGFIVIFKIMKGKTKFVDEYAQPPTTLEPTPQYDCHMTKDSSKVSKENHTRNFQTKQYYLYERDELGFAMRPRQIVPYAILHYAYVSDDEAVKQKDSCPTDIATAVDTNAADVAIPSFGLQTFPLWKGKLFVKGDLFCDVHMNTDVDVAANVAFLGTDLDVKIFLPMQKFSKLIPSALLAKSKNKHKVLHQGRHYNTFILAPSDQNCLGKFGQLITYLVEESAVAVIPLRVASCLYLMADCELATDVMGLEVPRGADNIPNTDFLYVLVVTPESLSSKINERNIHNLVSVQKRKCAERSASVPAELEQKLRSMKIESFAAVGSMKSEQLIKLSAMLMNNSPVGLGDEFLLGHYEDDENQFPTEQRRIQFSAKVGRLWSSTCQARLNYYKCEQTMETTLNGHGKKSILKGKTELQSKSKARSGTHKARNAVKLVDQNGSFKNDDESGNTKSFSSVATPDCANESTRTTNKRKLYKEPVIGHCSPPAKISRPSFKPLEEALSSSNVAELMRHPDFTLSDQFETTHRVSRGPGFTEQFNMKRNNQTVVTFRQKIPFSTDKDYPYVCEGDPIVKSMLRALYGVWTEDIHASHEEREKVDLVRRVLHQPVLQAPVPRHPITTGQHSLHDSKSPMRENSSVRNLPNIQPAAQNLVKPPSVDTTLSATPRHEETSKQQQVTSSKAAQVRGQPQDPRLTRRSRLCLPSYRFPPPEKATRLLPKDGEAAQNPLYPDGLKKTSSEAVSSGSLKDTNAGSVAAGQVAWNRTIPSSGFVQKDNISTIMTRQKRALLANNKLSLKSSGVGTPTIRLSGCRALNRHPDINKVSDPRSVNSSGRLAERRFLFSTKVKVRIRSVRKAGKNLTLNARFQSYKEPAPHPPGILKRRVAFSACDQDKGEKILFLGNNETSGSTEQDRVLLTAEELNTGSTSSGPAESSGIVSNKIPIIAAGKRIYFDKPSGEERTNNLSIETLSSSTSATNRVANNTLVISRGGIRSPSTSETNSRLSARSDKCTFSIDCASVKSASLLEFPNVSPNVKHNIDAADGRCSPGRVASTQEPDNSQSSCSDLETVSSPPQLDDSYIKRVREKRIRAKQIKCKQTSSTFSPSLKTETNSCLSDDLTSHPLDLNEMSQPERYGDAHHVQPKLSTDDDERQVKSAAQSTNDDKGITVSCGIVPVHVKLPAPAQLSSESVVPADESEHDVAEFHGSNSELFGGPSDTLYSEIGTLLSKAREVKESHVSAGALSDRLLQLALQLRKAIEASPTSPRQDVVRTTMQPSSSASCSYVNTILSEGSCVSTRAGNGSLFLPTMATGRGRKAEAPNNINVENVRPDRSSSNHNCQKLPTEKSIYKTHSTQDCAESKLSVDVMKNGFNSVEMLKSSSNDTRQTTSLSDKSSVAIDKVQLTEQPNALVFASSAKNQEISNTVTNSHQCLSQTGLTINNRVSLPSQKHVRKFEQFDSTTQSYSSTNSTAISLLTSKDNTKITKSQKVAHVKPQPVCPVAPSFYIFNPRDHPTCNEIASLLLITKGIPFDIKHIEDTLASLQSDHSDKDDSFLQVTQDVIDKSLNVQSLWIVVRPADMDLLSSVPYMSIFKCAGRKAQFVQANNAEEVNAGRYINILNGECGILIPVSLDVILQSNSVFLQLIKWMGRLRQKAKQPVWRMALYEHIGKQLRRISTQSDVGEIRRKSARRLLGVLQEHSDIIINICAKDNNVDASQVLDSAVGLQLQNVTTTRHIIVLTEKGDKEYGKWNGHRLAGFAVATVHQFVRTVMEDSSEKAEIEKPDPYTSLMKLYQAKNPVLTNSRV